MSLDLTHPALHLIALHTLSYLVQLPAQTPLPPSLLSLLSSPQPEGTLLSLAFTAAEVSLILPAAVYDQLKQSFPTEGTKVEGPWSIIRVRGPMELHMTGVMARLTQPLKAAGVAIFATSTWDTDYLSVHEEDREKAIEALKSDGWCFDAE